jgi:hypothetical protein
MDPILLKGIDCLLLLGVVVSLVWAYVETFSGGYRWSPPTKKPTPKDRFVKKYTYGKCEGCGNPVLTPEGYEEIDKFACAEYSIDCGEFSGGVDYYGGYCACDKPRLYHWAGIRYSLRRLRERLTPDNQDVPF